MDENFAFWFPITYIEQLTLEGQKIKIQKLEEGHIEYGGVLMCGESRERILNSLHTKEFKKSNKRIERARICQTCQHKYRVNGRSAWANWVDGKPITPAVKLPPLVKP